MLCPIKVNSNTIELTMHTSCYCVLELLCVKVDYLPLEVFTLLKLSQTKKKVKTLKIDINNSVKFYLNLMLIKMLTSLLILCSIICMFREGTIFHLLSFPLQ